MEMINSKNHKLYIKNMVCPRCVDTVREIFDSLSIDTTVIELGEVTTTSKVISSQVNQLKERLTQRGFELLEDNNSKLISQTKAIIVEQIHHSEDVLTVNFSVLLAERLNHEYSSLSRLFSSVEGITIERFIMKQRIEKVKEFIIYNELTLSEIAFRMDYSSVAHLSSQFKKEIGMTPTQFKKLTKQDRQSLDSI
jgi:AraC-like DNA-binding protein